MADHQLFDLGDLDLDSGDVLPAAQLAYVTYGALDRERSNVVVIPSAYNATHLDSAWLVGSGRAVDTERWFVVATNQFGNGLSTSPSTVTDSSTFPLVSLYDNVRAQHRLLVERFNVTRVALVTGFSMGAQQTFHWACAYPELVEGIVAVCGSARTSAHNRILIDGAVATLDTAGAATLGRSWAPWGLSQAFYRNERWRVLGDWPTVEAFVADWYGPAAFAGDVRDLRSMFLTWRAADIAASPHFAGDIAAALGSIRARAIVMPCSSDLYFPPEDSRLEVAQMSDAELRVIESEWGHAAGAGANPPDSETIGQAIRDALHDVAG